MTTITCKIPEKLDLQLEALARRRRLTKSAVLREALEKTTNGAAGKMILSAYDMVRNLVGSLRGPRDLATNPKHLKGLGE